jgi:hypothetical protein
MPNRRTADVTALLAVADDPQAAIDLRRYFGLDPPAAMPFTGGRFDRLAGGGDRPATWHGVTADVLLPVQMLTVRVPARAALDLLEGPLGAEVSTHLPQVPPTSTSATTQRPAHVDHGAPADLAWRALTRSVGVGWVIAGKLVARQSPRLLPVYDEVVRCACSAPDGFWAWLHQGLPDKGGALKDSLGRLRGSAEIPAEISKLRILDVVLWMRHREQHRARACPGAIGLEGIAIVGGAN